MTPRLLLSTVVLLLCGCAAPPQRPAVPPSACAAGALQPPGDARVQAAIAEARRQHGLFGGQTIERNGGLFRLGRQEAESGPLLGAGWPAWQGVAAFWQALPPATVPAGLARTAVADAGAADAALSRAAILDTPWSAAFVSYLMKTAGFSGDEFAFSDSHSDYVRAALEASDAEATGTPARHAFRACDAATTPPRAGDLLCATRGRSAGITTFDALQAALRAAPGEFLPMHCDLVVRADGGLSALETIGGNVANSVTLSRMTLDGDGLLAGDYVSARAAPTERGHLSRRPWVVLLQFRR